jgi:rubrerythrin
MAKPEKYKHINFKPPVSVSNAAKTALEWKKKYKNEVKGGTQVGWTRANQLANREELSPETIKRMKAFFDRHQGNQKVKAGDKPWEDNGRVAWMIWGSDPGYSWAKKVVKQMEAADKKREAAQRIAYMFIQAKDRIPGELADKKSPEDFDKGQLEKGIKVELEHTNNKSIAKEIAMDHLTEDPKYYDKLKKIETHKSAQYMPPAPTSPENKTSPSAGREIVEYRIMDSKTKQQVGNSYKPAQRNRARSRAKELNQQYGAHRYMAQPIFSDHPSLQEKTAIDFTSIAPTLNPDRPMTVRELARAIRLAITAEHDAVQLYELIADSTPDVAVRKIMQDVANEEKEHVGEFEELLARIDPENEHFVGEGVEEAEELITEKYAFTLEDILDRAADKLEKKGFKKEAYIIDTVTNSLSSEKTAGKKKLQMCLKNI